MAEVICDMFPELVQNYQKDFQERKKKVDMMTKLIDISQAAEKEDDLEEEDY